MYLKNVLSSIACAVHCCHCGDAMQLISLNFATGLKIMLVDVVI